MKTKMTITAMLLAIFSFGAMAQTGRTASIDLENSSVQWVGKKVTGAHEGNIKISEGQLVINGTSLTGGNFTIDMTSITVTDIENEGTNAKLVGHLKSDDFFGTDKFKTAKVVLKSVEKTGSQPATGKALAIINYDIVGSFTIKGITKDITFPATVTFMGASGARADAKITIDRTLFDIHYGSDNSLGDKMIYKNFDLNVSIAIAASSK
jgi:polyisoprenoid-binding protein YceI